MNIAMQQAMEKISPYKIVPVIKLNRASDAQPLGEALTKAGLPLAEITFRTDAAEEAIRNMARHCPGVFVGAGSIAHVEQAKAAVAAGSRFLVSAGFSRPVVEFAVENRIPIFPGACTPTEILMLLEFGLPVAKFFPAKQFGGLDTIKALAAPFPGIKFMPTGGINQHNLAEYLVCPHVVACGGSWMVSDALIEAGRFDEIEALSAQAVKTAQSAAV